MLPSVYLHQSWQSCLFVLWFNTGTRCGRPFGDVFARLLVTGTRGNWCTYISYCRPLQWRQVGRLNIPNLDSQYWSGFLREIAHDYPLSCIQSISQSVLHPTYSWGLRFWVCHPWGLTMFVHYVPINSSDTIVHLVLYCLFSISITLCLSGLLVIRSCFVLVNLLCTFECIGLCLRCGPSRVESEYCVSHEIS